MKKGKITILAISGALALAAGAITTAVLVKNGFAQEKEGNQTGLVSEEFADGKGIEVKFLSNSKTSEGYDQRTFTYGVTPENAPQEVNVELSWAEEKEEAISEYVTASSSAEEGTITIVCKKAFATVINVNISSVNDPTKKATVTLNYVQKFLGWADQGEGKAKKEEIISSTKSPTAASTYKEAMAKQANARFTPTLSEVYTKGYPAGNEAGYAVVYSKVEAYAEGSAVSEATMGLFKTKFDAKGSASNNTVWTGDSSAAPLEALSSIYGEMTYAQQRELNAAGYIGFKRTYAVKATLGDEEKDYETSWIIKAKVSELASYVADISSITTEVTNIDF